MSLYAAGGTSAEPAELAGISTVMMRTSVKGTQLRSADDIAGESEMLGGSISTSMSSDGGGWSFSVPVTRFRDAISLLQDVVQHPRFDDAAIDTERSVALSQIAQLRDDMMRYPLRLTNEAAFGEHPYGRYQLGSEETLRSLSGKAVRQWHVQSVLSSGAVAAAVGDVDEEELAQALADAFRELVVRDVPQLPAPEWPEAFTQRVEHRDKAQTALAMAFPGPSRTDPDRFNAAILSAIASGLGGRFFDELRDKRSLAYTVHAWSAERVRAGLFTAYIATGPAQEEEARAGLLAEIQRLRDDPVTAEELQRATRYALGSHAIALQSGSMVLAEMLDAWLFGSGLEELEEYEARIASVTAESILSWARKALDPERRVEGVVRGK
jgi:zinc protease